MNLNGTSQVFLVVAGLLVKLVQVVLDLGLIYFLNPTPPVSLLPLLRKRTRLRNAKCSLRLW